MTPEITYVYPYKVHSEGANALAQELGIRIASRNMLGELDRDITRRDRRYTVINWGSGELPYAVRICQVINNESAVNTAINKILTFRALETNRVSCVPWTQDHPVALSWLRDGSKVCVRSNVEGRDGAGLSIVSPSPPSPEVGVALEGLRMAQEALGGAPRYLGSLELLARVRSSLGHPEASLPPAPLYTKFIPSTNEWRVNVCFERTMGVQRKVPRADATGWNPEIKTTSGGYGFQLTDIFPNGLRPLARSAILALGLDFGGVDILQDGNNFYVLEVNTAPDLTPAMVTAFANRFREVLP